MKKRTFNLSIVLAIAAAFILTASTYAADTNPATGKAEVQQVMKTLETAWVKKDLKAVRTHYTDDATLTDRALGQPWTIDEYIAFAKQADPESGLSAINVLNVTVNGNTASVTALLTSNTMGDMMETYELKKTGGVWKITKETNS